jgi:hypothetical protein
MSEKEKETPSVPFRQLMSRPEPEGAKPFQVKVHWECRRLTETPTDG